MPGKTYTAKNGAKYTKNARGQVRFISGASAAYLAKIRKKRGKAKPKAKAKGGGLALGRRATNIGRRAVETGKFAGSVGKYAAKTAMRAAKQTGRGVRKGGGLGRKAGNFATGFGKISVRAVTSPGTRMTARYAGQQFTNKAKAAGKLLRKGGALVNPRARGPAKRKRRVTGGGVHSKTTVKFG